MSRERTLGEHAEGIRGACAFIGLGICVCSVPEIFYNEFRSAETVVSIAEGRKAYKQTHSCTANSMNNGSLISMTNCTITPGFFPRAKQPGTVAEAQLVHGLPHASSLSIKPTRTLGDDVLSWTREGQQYQLLEKHTRGKGHYFTYHPGWYSDHQRWVCTDYISSRWYNTTYCRDQCHAASSAEDCRSETEWKKEYGSATGQVDNIYLWNQGERPRKGVKSKVYIGKNDWGYDQIPSVGHYKTHKVSLSPRVREVFEICGSYGRGSGWIQYGRGSCERPQVGDWRWRWYYRTLPREGLSVLAMQVKGKYGTTFDAWPTTRSFFEWGNGDVGMLRNGKCDGNCMLNDMASQNSRLTDETRLLWWQVMCVGFAMMVCELAMRTSCSRKGLFVVVCGGSATFWLTLLFWLLANCTIITLLLILVCCCLALIFLMREDWIPGRGCIQDVERGCGHCCCPPPVQALQQQQHCCCESGREPDPEAAAQICRARTRVLGMLTTMLTMFILKCL